MIITRLSQIFCLLVTLALSACVTTSDSTLTRKADPDKAVSQYVSLGLEYIKRNDLQRARKHLNRALELQDDHAAANSALGLIYHEEGEGELAEAAFTKSLESDPNYTRGRTYFGAYLFSIEDYQRALEQFTKASEDIGYPSRSQVFTNIALCQLKLGDFDGALVAYDKTLRLDRTNGRALSGATELLIQKKNFSKAQKYYNRLLTIIRQKGLQHSAQSLWQGIRITRHFGNYEQAQSMASMLASVYPDSQEYSEFQLMIGQGSGL